MGKTMYMHTLDGQPASYHKKDKYLYFAGIRNKITLAESLRQIRKEQWQDAKSKAENNNPVKYGYVKVTVP